MNDMIICIGRQYGSGGREVGEKLAKRLGVTCYDKLLLKQAAKEGGVSLGEVERQDEKPVSASAFLSGNVFADSASIGGAFYSQSQLVYDAEKKAILDAAAKGGCVIIGRCASSILRDRKNVLSVFIYADEADRVARIARRNGLDEREARARMRKMDRMRKRYFDFYADTQWGDPESYDGGELVIGDAPEGVEAGIKLPAGHLLLYPASTVHHVTPVTRGERVASFFWIQSMIRSNEDRALLYDLDQTIQSLAATHGQGSKEVVRLTGTYHNLLRRWAEA